MARRWQKETLKGKLPEHVKEASLAALFDELEKFAATVLMKKLSPAAKKLMERVTGFAHGASIPQTAGARRLRGALTGAGSPQLMTEMHGMGRLLGAGERKGLQQARQHYEGVLARQGKVYKGVPGLEKRLKGIPGHPGQITRTPARVVQPGTVSASPRARREAIAASPTLVAPVNPYGATVMSGV
jgi:hypothetical protein